MSEKLIFFDFLNKEDVDYYTYEQEVIDSDWKTSINSLVRDHPSMEWLLKAFDWSKSQDGHDYWQKLNDVWISEVQMAKRKGVPILFKPPDTKTPEKEKSPLSFQDFLADKGVSYQTFATRVQKGKWYSSMDSLINVGKHSWIGQAFNWPSSPEKDKFWRGLDEDWNNAILRAEKAGREIIFYSHKTQLNEDRKVCCKTEEVTGRVAGSVYRKDSPTRKVTVGSRLVGNPISISRGRGKVRRAEKLNPVIFASNS